MRIENNGTKHNWGEIKTALRRHREPCLTLIHGCSRLSPIVILFLREEGKKSTCKIHCSKGMTHFTLLKCQEVFDLKNVVNKISKTAQKFVNALKFGQGISKLATISLLQLAGNISLGFVNSLFWVHYIWKKINRGRTSIDCYKFRNNTLFK